MNQAVKKKTGKKAGKKVPAKVSVTEAARRVVRGAREELLTQARRELGLASLGEVYLLDGADFVGVEIVVKTSAKVFRIHPLDDGRYSVYRKEGEGAEIRLSVGGDNATPEFTKAQLREILGKAGVKLVRPR